ncbi:MAG: hypothetical protein M1814_004684 [Vezdaea aestivalis]|nr:MAG: hypothetical protein M1814_004684 [Vezdaea aestivalis]
MKNLKTVDWTHWPLVGTREDISDIKTQSLPVLATTWDAEKSVPICVFGPTEETSQICLCRMNTGTGREVIAAWDVELLEGGNKVVCLQHFADSQTTCLVLYSGDVYLVQEFSHDVDAEIKNVGPIADLVDAACWSPDEDVLVVATDARKVLFITRDIEILAEVHLSTEDLKLSRQVSVGWGDSTTQFKGRGAKALKDPTIPEHVELGQLSNYEEFNGQNFRKETETPHRFNKAMTTFSWRGDGDFVAFSTIEHPDTGSRRVIRVFGRTGKLDSVSEAVDFQLGALSWRPSGNLIASIQYSNNIYRVIFFERNGLRHGEFDLRIDSKDTPEWASSAQLKWNADSSVLAVVFKSRVQLWTTNNYHWYLKQDIDFKHPVIDLAWYSENPLMLAVATKDDVWSGLYSWCTDRGTVDPPLDYGAVAVIDGRNLKVSYLRLHNIPPPDAWGQIEHSANIVAVAIHEKGGKFAILDEHGFSVYITKFRRNKPPKFRELKRHDFVGQSAGNNARQISFQGPKVCVLWFRKEGVKVITYQLANNNSVLEVVEKESFTKPRTVWASGPGFALLQPDGELFLSNSQLKSQASLVDIQIAKGNTELPYLGHFGLSRHGLLYADELLIAKNCTSFILTKSYLLFTTSNHLLKLLHLPETPSAYQVPPDNPGKDERCRRIERGSKLVTVMPTQFAAVLQAPRGNLETVRPRVLALSKVRELIENKKYKEAFLLCRAQRIDLNILYDHRPGQFLKELPLFLEQIARSDFIDQFLLQLKDEDVTVTMYADTQATMQIPSSEPPPRTSTGSKVNVVCEAIANEYLSDNQGAPWQGAVTACTRMSPPDLNRALQIVVRCKDFGADEHIEILTHLVWLADVDELYKLALGLYNLDLANELALCAQFDPQEYQPFLESVKQMGDAQRRFTLDDHLGRHAKALGHLFKCADNFSVCKAYIEKHSLYVEGWAYPDEPAEKREITIMHAKFLEQKSPLESAKLYESVTYYEEAAKLYGVCLEWEKSLICARAANFSAEDFAALARNLIAMLEEKKDWEAAATIEWQYLGNREYAITLYCRASRFNEASYLVTSYSHPQRIEDLLQNGIRAKLQEMYGVMFQFKEQLRLQLPKIMELRNKRAASESATSAKGGEDDQDAQDNNDDALSLASTKLTTNVSLFTRYSTGTQGSAKSARKEARRKASGRKGTPYEEGYQVESFGRLVIKVHEAKKEIRLLTAAMRAQGWGDDADAIRHVLMDVVNATLIGVREIWGERLRVGVGLEDEVARPEVGGLGEE